MTRHFCSKPRETAHTLCGAKITISRRGLTNFSVVRSRVTCIRCKAIIRRGMALRHRALAILDGLVPQPRKEPTE